MQRYKEQTRLSQTPHTIPRLQVKHHKHLPKIEQHSTHPSDGLLLHLLSLRAVEEIHARNDGLAPRAHKDGDGRPGGPVDAGAEQRAGDQHDQERDAPVAGAVRLAAHGHEARVDEQVDPGGGGHGGRDLGHAQAAALHDLAAARKRQQRDGQQARAARGRGAVGVLQRRGGDDEERLREVAQDQPEAQARADEVAELAGQVAAGEEEAEGDGDVGRVEGVAVELREDEGDGEEDCVARLVGGEAVIVREGDGICEVECEYQVDEVCDGVQDVDTVGLIGVIE